jgi:hypothetical protein
LDNNVIASHSTGWSAQDILTEIERCHITNAGAVEPQCLMIVDATRSGKTKLIKTYMERYPARFTDTGTHRPICYITVPLPATISNLATMLLYSLGDPQAHRGSILDKTHRIINYFKDCRVQMLVIDEIQHCVNRGSPRVFIEVSNWIKALIKETNVACVLLGLQGEAERVLRVNSQLARMFKEVLVLAPPSPPSPR